MPPHLRSVTEKDTERKESDQNKIIKILKLLYILRKFIKRIGININTHIYLGGGYHCKD